MKRRPVNILLQQLSARAFKRLDCEGVDLPAGLTLCEPGERCPHVYFPLSAVLTLVRGLSDGARIAVGLVGFEGFAPVAAIAPHVASQSYVEVQCAGKALAVTYNAFHTMLDEEPTFRRLMLSYVVAHDNYRGQLAACNRRHESVQRLARWLLMTNDRTGDPHIALSQQSLADALGVSRQAANVSVAELRRAECIEVERGEITIRDRRCLERAACECYRRMELRAA